MSSRRRNAWLKRLQEIEAQPNQEIQESGGPSRGWILFGAVGIALLEVIGRQRTSRPKLTIEAPPTITSLSQGAVHTLARIWHSCHCWIRRREGA